jgi:hypothetical protein
VLNDFHTGACGGHLSRLATANKILRDGYFWPSLFKYCIEAVKKCHPCQIFSRKMWAHPTPMFPVIVLAPSLSGELISLHATQILLGGIIISLW